MGIKHSSGPWYPVEYAGFWHIRTQPFYDIGVDVNDADHVGPIRAEKNAKLCAAAPELLEQLQSCIEQMQLYKNQPIPQQSLQLLEKLKAK